MMILLILCGLVSFAACALLLRVGQENARRYGWLPQRFHLKDTPRLGGIAMFAGCSIGWAWMAFAKRFFGIDSGIPFDGTHAMTWWIVALAGVASGVVEDITHKLHARSRFVSTFLAALLGVLMFELLVPRLGHPWVDDAWKLVPYAGMVLAVVALAGLPHAFNIIDGYNGLAGIVALIVSLAMAYIALQVGDRELAAIMCVLAGTTAGFLLWNYPHGLIFAGDGGAYLWGIVVAVASVLLVQRHPEVSPWFPVLLLIYPIWETVFSIYRKAKRGVSPGVADALHFHQLIFRRIVRQVLHDDEVRRMLIRNNRTSPYLWGFTLLTVVPAVLFWYSTPLLIAFTLLFIVSYIWCYFSIVRFRAQRWMRRRLKAPKP